MSIFVCGVCDHVEFGSAPDNCPQCGSLKENFNQDDNVFIEAAEKSKEGAHKHIPSIRVNKECKLIPEESCVDVIVRIGETLHPMEEKHFIQFADCYVDDQFVSRIIFTPGVYASGCFHLKTKGSKVRIVEFCSLHGHWHAEADL